LTSTPESTAAEGLLGELTEELSRLVRWDVELVVVRHAESLRRIGVELAVTLASATALLLGLLTMSWAATRALEGVLSTWAAPLLVGTGWLVVTALLVRLEHPRRFLRRLAAYDATAVTDAALRERREAQFAMRITAEQLAAAFARETVEREVVTDAVTAEHDLERILRALLALAVTPVRVWSGAFERLGARSHL